MAAPTQFITMPLAGLNGTKIPDGTYTGAAGTIEIGTLGQDVLVSTNLTEGDPVFLVAEPQYLPAEIASVVTQGGEAQVMLDVAFTIATGYGAGTYTVSSAQLADGVEFLIPSEITGDNQPGAILSEQNAAIYLYTGATAAVERNWQADGVDVAGATDPTGFDTTAHGGKTIRLRTRVNGVDDFSNEISISGASAFEYASLGGYDFVTGATTHTQVGVPIGPAAPDRKILIAFASRGTIPPSSVTVGGVALTRVAISGDTRSIVSFWEGTVPSGTAADITISRPAQNGLYALVQLFRIRNGTVVDGIYGDVATTTSPEVVLDRTVEVGDIVIAAANQSNSPGGANLGFTGLTLLQNSNHVGQENREQATAWAEVTTAQTPRVMRAIGVQTNGQVLDASAIIVRRTA